MLRQRYWKKLVESDKADIGAVPDFLRIDMVIAGGGVANSVSNGGPMANDEDCDIEAPTSSARVKSGNKNILFKQNIITGEEKIIYEQCYCISLSIIVKQYFPAILRNDT